MSRSGGPALEELAREGDAESIKFSVSYLSYFLFVYLFTFSLFSCLLECIKHMNLIFLFSSSLQNPSLVFVQTPMKQHRDCNFSYAGLKTQVRLAIGSHNMYVENTKLLLSLLTDSAMGYNGLCKQ